MAPRRSTGTRAVRVLLADKNALVRETLCELLESGGEVQVVARTGNGPEAVRLARIVRPAVAVLDIGLLQLNGIEAARSIRAEDGSMGVLILGTWDDSAYDAAAEAAGADRYVCKSANAEMIIEAVKQAARAAARRARMLRHPRLGQRTCKIARRGSGRRAVPASCNTVGLAHLLAAGRA